MNPFFLKEYITIIELLLIMQSYPTTENLWTRLDPSDYRKHCSFITKVQTIRKYVLIPYYAILYKNNLPKAISILNSKRKYFKKLLTTLEEKTLLAIKEKYQINNTLWNQFLTTISQAKKESLQILQQPHPNSIHDPNIPSDIKEELNIILKKNNINPKSISIQMISNEKKINKNPNTIAQVVSFILPKINKQKSLVFDTPDIPFCLELFPVVNNQSKEEKISLYAHEIEHLLQQHSLTILILQEYLKYYCHISSEVFQQTLEYHTLLQIHEAQAEIYAALKHPYYAHCLTEMRKKYYYPKCLYQEHFYHLSTIDMLWKVQKGLKASY